MSIDIRNIGNKKLPSSKGGLQKVLSSKIEIKKKELSLKKKEELYSELSILIGSGLDIKSSFVVLIQESKKETTLLYEGIYNRLLLGESLSNAFRITNRFSVYEYSTIQIGEETGCLYLVLKQLANHFSQRIKQKRQLINTFSYPALIIVTAIFVVLFMMNFIVPMFEELFKRFNGDLPFLTRVVIRMSELISSYFLFFTGLVLLTGFFLFRIRKTDAFRKTTSSFLLKIPGIRSVLLKIYLAKFCQIFALLSAAKLPIVTSIQLIQKVIGFYPLEKALLIIEDDITKGKLLHESFSSFPFFDAKLITLTKVGEEVNRLTPIYENLSTQYAEDVQHKISVLNSLMEPMLIIFIGIFVALILISMYLPMFQMSNSMF